MFLEKEMSYHIYALETKFFSNFKVWKTKHLFVFLFLRNEII